MDKKMIYGALFSVFIVAGLVGFRDHITKVWASPEEIRKVDSKAETAKTNADKSNETNAQLAKLIFEQNSRIDAQEKISALQIENLKELIDVTKNIKQKK